MQRVTDEFGAETVPAGLLRAHRLAAGTWGRLRVAAGTVNFAWEEGAEPAVALGAGDSVLIPPSTPHPVEPGADARFRVEFYR